MLSGASRESTGLGELPAEGPEPVAWSFGRSFLVAPQASAAGTRPLLQPCCLARRGSSPGQSIAGLGWALIGRAQNK